MSEYGKKGGTSANAGRKSTTYAVTLPDGTTAKKKSFHVHCDKALAGVFYSERDNKWIVSGITCEAKDWPGQQFVEARAV